MIQMSRYKFVAKMLEGESEVLEVGCSDGWKSRIVAQAVGKLTCIDVDRKAIDEVTNRSIFGNPRWQVDSFIHDMLERDTEQKFNAAFSLDVLEHIEEGHEKRFLDGIYDSLIFPGTCIMGMPSLESQAFASPLAKRYHVNCKTQEDLRDLMGEYFEHVFMFSMNDEVVHTGYGRMSHYNIALCAG